MSVRLRPADRRYFSERGSMDWVRFVICRSRLIDIPPPDTNSRISVLSFSGLRSHPLAETHAYTTTVFVSELDACGLERPPNHREGGLPRFRCFTLK
jgi:hypothetical protein